MRRGCITIKLTYSNDIPFSKHLDPQWTYFTRQNPYILISISSQTIGTIHSEQKIKAVTKQSTVRDLQNWAQEDNRCMAHSKTSKMTKYPVWCFISQDLAPLYKIEIILSHKQRSKGNSQWFLTTYAYLHKEKCEVLNLKFIRNLWHKMTLKYMWRKRVNSGSKGKSWVQPPGKDVSKPSMLGAGGENIIEWKTIFSGQCTNQEIVIHFYQNPILPPVPSDALKILTIVQDDWGKWSLSFSPILYFPASRLKMPVCNIDRNFEQNRRFFSRIGIKPLLAANGAMECCNQGKQLELNCYTYCREPPFSFCVCWSEILFTS